MNRRGWILACAVAIAGAGFASSISACGSDDVAPPGDTDGGGDESTGSSGFIPPDSGGDGGPTQSNNCSTATSLTLSPADKVANVTLGGAFTQAYTVVAHYAGKADQDVTSSTFFTISDPGAGKFTGNTFTWSGTQGGVLTVSALSCGITGTTHLTLKVAASFGAGGLDAGTSGGGDAGLTGQFNGAPATGTAACNPSLVYPPDNVLVPPNMNVVEIHFTEGTPANNLFEISFENAVTDVKVYTACNGTTPGAGQPSSTLVPPVAGGCIFELDQAEWDYIAKTNRDGDPVNVSVKGLGCDGTGGAGVSNTRKISFAKEDMRGTLYYWASERITIGGAPFNSGGVYRYDFGVRGQTAEPVLTPNTGANPTHLCIGCHDISRDGRQMVFDFDDNDADDEYSDVRTDVYDIAAATPAQAIVKNGTNVFPPGFHTWNRTTTEFLLSDGFGDSSMPAGAFRRVTPKGVTSGYTIPGTLRGTTPDWAPDDSRVVYVVPPNPTKVQTTPVAGFWMNKGGIDDEMFAGATLYGSAWNPTTKTLGAPAAILTSNGTDNFYYPSFSPEGSLIVYNHADSGSNFHNPLAKVEVINATAATPTRDALTKLNDTGDITNSWARWAPFVQTYKGKKLLWVTTSSTRNYGLRIDNGGLVNCYPKETPNFVTPDFSQATNCTRTQLWMAAIDLDPAAVQAGTDVSHPAFYLPFQDITTNNHLGQWAQQSFTGVCKVDMDCSAQPGKCCDMGGCTACPTPPAAMCASNANCAPGSCCTGGACAPCAPGTDAGTGGPGQTSCGTCLDCKGQACNGGVCGSCSSSADCCAPLSCVGGSCVNTVN